MTKKLTLIAAVALFGSLTGCADYGPWGGNEVIYHAPYHRHHRDSSGVIIKPTSARRNGVIYHVRND